MFVNCGIHVCICAFCTISVLSFVFIAKPVVLTKTSLDSAYGISYNKVSLFRFV